MVAGVEFTVESGPGRSSAEGSLEVRLLGALSIRRNGLPQALPASRKVRGLLAWLALAPQAVDRSQLCELLWEDPNDPRGELRSCLSKIRGLVDEAGRKRVRTENGAVRLDLSDCLVDAVEVARAASHGLQGLDAQRQHALLARFGGDFLEGLEVDRCPAFSAWLVAQRRRFRGYRVALLEQICGSVADEEALGCLEQWLQISPFDPGVHERLLRALVRQGKFREADEHLAAALRRFEADGLDGLVLHQAWRSARAQGAGPAAGSVVVSVASDRSAPPAVVTAARRASVVVMPFVERQAAPAMPPGGLADALAHDVITRLAKLRSLFVIAQGTVFALHARGIGLEEAGRMLNADYVVGGAVRRHGERLAVEVELAEVRTARVIWSETLNHRLDDTFLMLEEIGNQIVASVAGEIEMIERNRAILKPPNSLDAWEALHRGLWHMYRFNKADNDQARHFLEAAVRLDPTFARAWAGLSFTHFQNAFQGWAEREPEVDLAFEAAGKGLMVDDRDPSAHWAMGRALWLRGRHDPAVIELEQAIELSPNFALAHYTLAFVQAQDGDAHAAIVSSDHSRQLSPFDPLLFGMCGARAIALVRLGRFDEAAEWGIKAAARPNAHQHIFAIAALSLALAGRLDEARTHAVAILRLAPQYRVADFLAAFQLDPDGAALFREGARRIGMA